MIKKYEVLRDGSLEQSFEKCREGMNEALDLVEQLALDWSDDFDLLEIVCTEYDAMGQIVSCEQIQEFEDDSVENDINESMDGDFDSAMTSAGFGTDEDYGYFGDE
jgi:DNA recombination-dependent growth factor C